MATPLKTFLSTKGLSPLSPRFLSTLPKNNGRPSPNKKKKLDVPRIRANLFNNQIEIKVTNDSKENNLLLPKRDVLINSPIKYQILKAGLEENTSFNILGRGGFGKVIRASYLGEIVAMKVVKSKKLSREKNALGLCHENIVKLLNIIHNENDDYTIILMEYFPDCIQLQHLIEDNGTDLELLQISIDISRGLEYCHDRSILHLDIKPQNILLCGGTIKICDFGNSFSEEDLNDEFKHNGTVHYTAPELLLGQNPTAKCDIYSLGIVFWQLKHRKNPYDEFYSNEEIIYKVVKYNYRPEMSKSDNEYSLLYQNCWGNQPNCRPTIKDVLEKLYVL